MCTQQRLDGVNRKKDLVKPSEYCLFSRLQMHIRYLVFVRQASPLWAQEEDTVGDLSSAKAFPVIMSSFQA